MKKLAWAAAALLCCGSMASPAHAQRQDRNRIRADEIQQSNATTVFQLIQSRRGMWFMRNQPVSMNGTSGLMLVFLDGAQLDGVETLREVPTTGVQLVEFLTPSETEHKLGKYTTVGTIRVLSHDDSPPPTSTHVAHRR